MGDEVVIDGGMASFEVIEKIGSDLRCKCTDPGLFLPLAKLSFWRDGKLVERHNELPTLSTKVDYPLLFSEYWLILMLLYLHFNVHGSHRDFEQVKTGFCTSKFAVLFYNLAELKKSTQ